MTILATIIDFFGTVETQLIKLMGLKYAKYCSTTLFYEFLIPWQHSSLVENISSIQDICCSSFEESYISVWFCHYQNIDYFISFKNLFLSFFNVRAEKHKLCQKTRWDHATKSAAHETWNDPRLRKIDFNMKQWLFLKVFFILIGSMKITSR